MNDSSIDTLQKTPTDALESATSSPLIAELPDAQSDEKGAAA
jgi:hypothetical protein